MQGKNILITGGAGFIGSNMVEKLLPDNNITVLDNLNNHVGNRFITQFMENKNFHFINTDLLSFDYGSLKGIDTVIHFAANSDVRYGSQDPTKDFQNNVVATENILEYMRKYDVKDILFASSSTVYGEASIMPTPENYGPYMPISSYGASKMSNEGFITAYSHYYGFKGSIFRFANIVGKNSTHGVIYDFINKLLKSPDELEILGDGTQKKSYMHVKDCVDSMIYVHEKLTRTDIINLGNRETTSVKTIADYVVKRMGLKNVKYRFTGGINGRGWKGDIKITHLAIDKLLSTGWKSRYTSDESVDVAVQETIDQLKNIK
ncbi:NAD-dependent epimerase/dehydratase family protein [Ferroplasma acidiphilum]|jgi:UDP-glucose 4-epimerase|uniref:UDP-glucose 4-epimerase n=1 Tax=Ferroplasma acidiphilum TaxID=74969 RepID=A0A1V0N691_9ARCH|nr:NAD-dependent epimerase/dehydratase family protein [Ferroplasma acidiphilum]ARD85605.1 UDP-glucose 4-epimerase [Ferroplasma acidiphilum]MCL4349445.1 NAD-dependent epimerase/dehydratase family protein [Candidatus Thermoplasmatota archaeon]